MDHKKVASEVVKAVGKDNVALCDPASVSLKR